jgi:hypothetical protein
MSVFDCAAALRPDGHAEQDRMREDESIILLVRPGVLPSRCLDLLLGRPRERRDVVPVPQAAQEWFQCRRAPEHFVPAELDFLEACFTEHGLVGAPICDAEEGR